MGWSWFDIHWCWIGLAISAALLTLLFGTNIFRGNIGISRWRDPLWLAWLAPASYMLHQFEEYGIDAQGVRFAFPDVLCGSVGMPPYPACSLPEAVFVAINIPVIWVAGLACALLARRHPFVGLGLYAIHFTNALSHIGVAVASGYNPGAVTATLIQLPLSLWVGYACFGPGRIIRWGAAIIVAAGAAFTVILLVSVNMFAKGMIGASMLVIVQILNASLVVLVPWVSARWVMQPVR
ncbi:uncharacterized protein with HXXEE motif [Novosphingobium sp. PhB57]|uniref:HXXEE domain-containing protein n=1 Tax=Novosphingobium sp. PhB57 TaxID=2485107 RepID=UPI001050216B|nr:HXXEE domain-containing protein [Novosphingobium sp. PhB57]TCU54700.1 uncharacterized protein with HXXEE motif [Novosphingobium sp. PhB57]